MVKYGKVNKKLDLQLQNCVRSLYASADFRLIDRGSPRKIGGSRRTMLPHRVAPR